MAVSRRKRGPRSRRITFVLAVFATAMTLIATSCTKFPVKSSKIIPKAGRKKASLVQTQDQVEVYQLVVKRLCGPDDTFGGQLKKRVVYIVRSTDDATSNPSLPRGQASVTLSPRVQMEISERLRGTIPDVKWVDSADDVPKDLRSKSVLTDGVIVTLGSIRPSGAQKVLVSASIYIANLASGGKTYIVEKIDGVWRINGTTGAEWMS